MNRTEAYDPRWSKVGAPLAAQAVTSGEPATRQYTLFEILAIWAGVTVPMGLLAFIVAPAVMPHTSLHPGLVHWIFMVVGMVWQFIVSVAVLRHELGGLRWAAVKKRIWLNRPRDPRTGGTRWTLWLWVVPAILANLIGGLLAAPLDRALTSWLPALGERWYANIDVLADEQFEGQWWILGLALTSSLFNYILGEELLFRGVLLPRMAGVFGRWDWVANTVLFGLYHVHKIWFWPSMMASSFGCAWAARRYHSMWMGVIVHGVEGFFILLVVAVLAGWYP
jgi:membrane protease YdiL (CAAX protease family)